jgi:hypothetical protein
MPYAYLNFSQMQSQLAARLADGGMVFFPQGHLRSVLKEALRTWQSMSTVQRGRFTFNHTAATPFYDLANVTGSLIPRTLTDRDLVNDLQYALMEPVNDFSSSTTWGGTEQFSMDDLVKAIQRRRDQFLLETGCVITASEIAAGSPFDGRVPLNDSIIDVRRAVWKNLDNVYSTLWRSDERQLNSLLVGWATTGGTPQVYSTIVVPPITLQLGPIPDANGSIHLLTINAGQALDVATGVGLGIPDDFAWAIKFGALADLLSRDGEARDPARAAHAEQRYAEGVMIAKITGSVLNLEVNGAQTPIVDLQSLDAMNPGWQTIATNSGTPTVGAMAGLNLIGFSPVPSAASSVTIDCIRNAPIPANDAAQVQLAREHLDVVLDYAEYLARFKEGGAEWEATMPLAQNMLRLAADNNDRLRAQAQLEDELRSQSQREADRRPMRIAAA